MGDKATEETKIEMHNESNSEPTNESQKEKDPKPQKTNSTSKDFRKAISSTFLQTYGFIPLSLIVNWMIARSISKEIWGIFIHSIILVRGGSIILSFIPPAIFMIILYKVPEMKVNNDWQGIKSLTQYAMKVKIIGSVITTLAFFSVCFYFYAMGINATMMLCIMIYCPFIIIFEICSVITYFFNAIKKFFIAFYLNFIERILVTLLYVFIFYFSSIPRENLVYYMIAIELFAFIPITILGLYLYNKELKNIPYKPLSWNQIKDTLNLGVIYTISSNATGLQEQAAYLVIDQYGGNQFKTYYNIPKNFTGQAANAFILPIGPILTEYEKQNKREEMIQIYTKAQSIMSLILCLISGFLYYFLKIYIVVIYTPDYLEVSDIIRNYVFSIILMNILLNLNSLYTVTRNEKPLMYINIIHTIIAIILSIIGYAVWDFIGFVIAQIIGLVIGILICWSYAYFSKANIRLPLFQLLKYFLELVLIITISNAIITYFKPEAVLTEIVDFIIQNIEFLNVDYTFKISIIVNSLFDIAVFFLVFVTFQIIFIKAIREDLRTILNQNVKIPFRGLFIKVLRL